jgi:hypothetical protein
MSECQSVHPLAATGLRARKNETADPQQTQSQLTARMSTFCIKEEDTNAQQLWTRTCSKMLKLFY